MPTFTETADRITIDELYRRGSLKWTRGGPGVIGAFIAEMDFGAAPAISEALRDAIGRADFGYLSDHAVADLAQACAAWQHDSYGWTVDPARVRPLPDVIKGMEAAITVFSRPRAPVIVPTPAYMPFLTWPARLGREIIQVPMTTEDGRPALDLNGIDAAFREGGHLLILCNPCNPVGRVYTKDELARVAEVVARNDGRVYADEIHAPLVYPGGTHIPYASVSQQAANHSVTGTAASKGWNLPGLKCAQLILTNDADAAIWAEGGFTFEHGTSILGVRASAAAYRDGSDWLADVVGYLDGSRELLAGLLAEHLPEIRYQPPEGTYLAWLDCRDLFPDGSIQVSPAEFFRATGRVLLTDGAACGDAGRGHVRLNFATPRPILTEIVRRMAAAVHGALAHPGPGLSPWTWRRRATRG
jgi:cysteine-S-conjugate beta-lyase